VKTKRRFYVVTAVFALIASVFVSAPAQAAITQTTTTAGVIYGKDYYANPNPRLNCSSGYALTSTWSNATLTGSNEDYSLAFAISCTKLNDDRTLNASLTEKITGLQTQPPNLDSSCTSGKVATGIRVTVINSKWVTSTGVVCSSFLNNSGAETRPMANTTTPTANPAVLVTSTSSCQAGSYVVGVEYEHGSGLHEVGVLCAELAAPQSAISITTTSATYGTNLTLASSGGSTGGTYNYSKVSGNCTLSGAVLTPTGTGSCVVQSNLSANSFYVAETSTATTITIAAGSSTASLTLAPGNLTFRQPKNITAVATVAGKITFRVAGKILPGCKNRTVNAGNSFTAICSYRPANHSYVTISATLTPTDVSYLGTVTNSAQYLVTRRTGSRISP
jgi:hypothetical protein